MSEEKKPHHLTANQLPEKEANETLLYGGKFTVLIKGNDEISVPFQGKFLTNESGEKYLFLERQRYSYEVPGVFPPRLWHLPKSLSLN